MARGLEDRSRAKFPPGIRRRGGFGIKSDRYQQLHTEFWRRAKEESAEREKDKAKKAKKAAAAGGPPRQTCGLMFAMSMTRLWHGSDNRGYHRFPVSTVMTRKRPILGRD